MTPMTTKDTIEIIDCAIGFERACESVGIDRKQARRLAAALGALPAEQLLRICRHALENERRQNAALERHRKRRGR